MSGICGTDVKIYEGSIQVRYPVVMGHEMAGEVQQGGDDRLRDGDRVLIDPVLSCGKCFSCCEGLTNLCSNGGLLGRDTDGGLRSTPWFRAATSFPCRTRSIAARLP